jgi:hypothetical protein
MTDFRKVRVRLPGSLTGLGITSYDLAARPAYLGCLSKVGPRLTAWISEPELDVVGFPEARAEVQQELVDEEGASPVPDIEEFFYPQYGPRQKEEEGQRHLQRVLTEAVHKKTYERVAESATEDETFILRCTSSTTAGDVFFVSTTCRRNALPRQDFLCYARLYLDLPVCAGTCSVGHVVGITRDARHAYEHAHRRIKERHDGVAATIGAFFRLLRLRGEAKYRCSYEVPLDQLSEQLRRVPGKAALRCDFLLENEDTGELVITDVKVTHPDRGDRATHRTPLVAAEAGWNDKRRLYTNSYEAVEGVLPDSTFQPLVFEVYGGWAQGTYEFLWAEVRAIAGDDARLFSRLWRDLRDRVAVALARGQGEVIRYFNFRNSTAFQL